MENNIKFNVQFYNGAFVEIIGEEGKEYGDDYSYEVIFLDNDTNKLIHSTTLGVNYWTKPNLKYFANWKVVIMQNNVGVVHEEVMNLNGKDVLIVIENKPLGDNISWIPYCEEFRKKHNCNVTVQTFFPDLFEKSYSEIKFQKTYTTHLNDPQYYASYKIAYGFSDSEIKEFSTFIDKSRGRFNYYPFAKMHKTDETPNHPALQPLQKMASDILGLEYKELRPKFIVENEIRPIEKKYVCISEFASGKLKMWSNQVGWQTLVDEIKRRGFEVVSISKEKSDLKNITKRNGNYSLLDRIWYLNHCEFFIGVSSALAWLAWGCNKKVVMISGITHKWNEFQEDNIRIINEDVCHGCWNSNQHCDKFAKFLPDFCPENKRWECSRKISPKMVINQLLENNLI